MSQCIKEELEKRNLSLDLFPALNFICQNEHQDVVLNSLEPQHLNHIKSLTAERQCTIDAVEFWMQELVIRQTSLTCPICEEGYFGKWVDGRGELVLLCPECGYLQNKNGKASEYFGHIEPFKPES
jgi:hypothetical protein